MHDQLARRWYARSKLLFAALLVLLLLLPAARAGQRVAAQSGGAGFAVRFQGNLTLSGDPAPSGTTITVITARSINDVTVCGTGSVTGGHGEYSVDVQAIPYCAESQHITVPIGPYIFIVNGENVGGGSPDASLDSPSSLGQVVHTSLVGTAIPGFKAPSGGYGPIMMPAMRFYGNLTLAGDPAPVGTTITVETSRSASDTTACGTGTVTGGHGEYSVDVQAIPYCAESQRITVPIGPYIFIVNGENVGGGSPDASLDSPSSLGQVVHTSLLGTQAPPAPAGSSSNPLQGNASTTNNASPPLQGNASNTGTPTSPPVDGGVDTGPGPGPQPPLNGGTDTGPGPGTPQPPCPDGSPPAPDGSCPAPQPQPPQPQTCLAGSPPAPDGSCPTSQPPPCQPTQAPPAEDRIGVLSQDASSCPTTTPPPLSAQVWSVEFAATPVTQDCDTANPVAASQCPAGARTRTVDQFQGQGCSTPNPNANADWQDCTTPPDGIPEKLWPVTVVAGSNLTIKEARFRIPAGTQLTQAAISAEATAVPEGTSQPIKLTFPVQNAQISGDELVVQNLKSNEVLPNIITALSPLTITWSLQTQSSGQTGLAGEIGTGNAGTSSHLIYVMRAASIDPTGIQHRDAKPTEGATPYVSLVSLTVHAALGDSADPSLLSTEQVFKHIWSAFTSLNIQRRDLDPAAGGNEGTALVTPGETLHYWNPWSLQDVLQGGNFVQTQNQNCSVNTVLGLLSATTGTCGAWANFFADALGVQGLPSQFIDEVFYLNDPLVGSWSSLGFPADATFMLVGKDAWQFSTPSSQVPGYPYQVTAQTNPFAFQQQDFNYVTGNALLAQGNSSPPGMFTTGDHAVVIYDGQLYDPSYGNGPFNTIQEWASASLAGYATFGPGSAQGQGPLACPIDANGVCTFYAHMGLTSP